jgi:hypothetical protein
MGVVYEAEQRHPRRLVAVKCIHPWLQSESLRERFHTEAILMAKLLHPNIPQIYEAGQDGTQLYLAMERVQGRGLHDWAESRGLRERAALLLPVLDAVQHAHEHGVVHCDLKPANLLVSEQGQPKILDFGVSSSVDERRHGGALGTPHYMSPEQLRGDPVPSPGWDVFALGVLAYELFTGRHPFRVATRDRQRILEAIARGSDPMDLRQGLLGREIEEVISRAIAADPADRYPAAEAMRLDLVRALDHRPLSLRPATPVYKLRLWVERHRRISATAALGLALLLIVSGGDQALELRERRRTEADAERVAAVVAAQVERQLDADQLDEAEATWRAFSEDPAWRHTRVLFQARLEHAARNAALGHTDAELSALAEAFVDAADEVEEAEALRRLAQAFARLQRWGALGSALDLLRRHGQREPVLELQEALGMRDLARALRVLPQGDPRQPLLQALLPARALPFESHRVDRDDLDGDGQAELFGAVQDGLQVLRPDGGIDLLRFPGPAATAFWLPELRLLLVQSLAPATALWALQPKDGALELAWSIEEAAASSAAAADMDGDGELEIYIGTGAYSRHLVRVASDGSDLRDGHPATSAANSDIEALVVSDIDGDGRAELVASSARWEAYDIRVLGQGEGGAELLDRQRWGVVSDIRELASPRRRRLLAFLEPEDPAAPLELRILRWDGAGLRVEESVTLPRSTRLDAYFDGRIFVGDFDGDGANDIALGYRPDEGDRTVLLRSLPDGDFAVITLDGVKPTGSFDFDDDGDDELLLEVDRWGTQWLLGAGGGRLPGRSRSAKASSVPAGLERVEELRAMGLGPSAARAAENLAPFSDYPAEGLYLAAELWEQEGQLDRALALLERSLEHRTSQSAVRVDRARLLAELERYPEAVAAWRELREHPELRAGAEAELAWLEPLIAPRPTVQQLPGEAPAGWQLHRPLALRSHRSDVLFALEAVLGDGRLVTLPLEQTGPDYAVELDLRLSQLEMASRLEMAVLTPDGVGPRLRIQIHGGGGVFLRSIQVQRPEAHAMWEPVHSLRFDPRTYNERIRLRLHTVRGRDGALLELEGDRLERPVRAVVDAGVLPEGSCSLVLSTGEDPTEYDTPMRMQVALERLRLEGFEPRTQGGDARWLLDQRDPAVALAQLGDDQPHARLAALRELGRLQEASALASRLLLREPDDAARTLRHLDESLGPLLHQALGARYLDLWSAAYDACLSHPEHPRCGLALGRPDLTDNPCQTPAQRWLLLRQAEAQLELGADARAEAALQRLIHSATPAEAQLLERSWLGLRTLACRGGDRDAIARAEAGVLSVSPSRELAGDRLERSVCER